MPQNNLCCLTSAGIAGEGGEDWPSVTYFSLNQGPDDCLFQGDVELEL
jgi:hypothetical protein